MASDALVVVTIENPTDGAVSTPEVRVALPDAVEYKGIADGLPGTTATLVELENGRALDIRLPVRLPPRQARRVALHKAPHHKLTAEDFLIQASPQPTATSPALSASTAVATQQQSQEVTRPRWQARNATRLRSHAGAD
jgi:hypothetical protein